MKLANHLQTKKSHEKCQCGGCDGKLKKNISVSAIQEPRRNT